MKDSLLRIGLLLLTLATCTCTGGTGNDPHPLPATNRCNVILLSIDTLRADRLGLYGYDRDTSPSLDAFAAGGAVFNRVVAESPWTLPSHVTMLSGLYPSTHGVCHPRFKPGPDTRLLAEILAEEGYRTVGFTDGLYLDSQYGMDRGFHHFDDSRKGLMTILSLAGEQLELRAQPDPLFLFLHTYDVHCPYDPDERYAGQFVSNEARVIETEGRCGQPHFNSITLSPGQVRYLSDLYDASIREADDHLKPFFDFLVERGLLENTVVVITSDHGEEFQEHGRIGHDRTLHREVLMIPLVIVAPGLQPVRVKQTAGLVDIVPTILDLLGIPVPEKIEGLSLLPAINNDLPHDGEVTVRISELNWKVPLRSVMDGDRHFILDMQSHRPELYFLNEDPEESQNRIREFPEEEQRLLRLLRAYDEQRVPRKTRPRGDLDKDKIEQLRALGYMQ